MKSTMEEFNDGFDNEICSILISVTLCSVRDVLILVDFNGSNGSLFYIFHNRRHCWSCSFQFSTRINLHLAHPPNNFILYSLFFRTTKNIQKYQKYSKHIQPILSILSFWKWWKIRKIKKKKNDKNQQFIQHLLDVKCVSIPSIIRIYSNLNN